MIDAAYGIKYPDHAFWKSFIATRDEYKKFFVTFQNVAVLQPNLFFRFLQSEGKPNKPVPLH